MNWEFIIQKILDSAWDVAIMLSAVSLLRLSISQWFMVKLAQVKTSKIIIRNNEKTASFQSPEDGSKVIQILKNSDKMDSDFFDESS